VIYNEDTEHEGRLVRLDDDLRGEISFIHCACGQGLNFENEDDYREHVARETQGATP